MTDWVEWDGGKCPVPRGRPVQVRHRNGDVFSCLAGMGPAESWGRMDGTQLTSDIVAYRLAQTGQAPSPTVTAPAILNKAAALMEERGKQYDQPEGERSMGRAVAALNAVLGRPALTESEGWLLLQLLKDVRDRQRAEPHLDSLEDGVAYAALKAESRLQEKASPK